MRLGVKWDSLTQAPPPQDHVSGALYLSDREPFVVLRFGSNALWVLHPHVHPEGEREYRFRKSVLQAFGIGIDDLDARLRDGTWIRSVLSDDDLLARLKECYRDIRSDRNLTSMSLYSGPIRSTPTCEPSLAVHLAMGATVWHVCPIAGWVGTGDAALDVRKRRNSLYERFAEYKLDIGHLVLPHHGSDENFSDSLLGHWPLSMCSAVAAAHNGYGHPSPNVRLAVQGRGILFWQTTESPKSKLVETIFGVVGK